MRLKQMQGLAEAFADRGVLGRHGMVDVRERAEECGSEGGEDADRAAVRGFFVLTCSGSPENAGGKGNAPLEQANNIL